MSPVTFYYNDNNGHVHYSLLLFNLNTIYDVLTTLRRMFFASYLESAAPEDGIGGWFFHKDYTEQLIKWVIRPMCLYLVAFLGSGRASPPFAIARILLIIQNFLVDFK